MLHMPTPMLLGGGQDGPDPSAAAYFAAMTVQPDAARKALIEAFIVGLKGDGIWSKLDCLWLIASHDAQAGRLNAASPGSQTLAPQNSPSYTTDRGYTCNGTSSYLRTGYIPGSLFTQNSAHASTWLNAVTSETASNIQFSLGYLGSVEGALNSLILQPRTTNGAVSRVNGPPGTGYPTASTKLGMVAGSRVSGTSQMTSKNSDVQTQTTNSVALDNREVGLMRFDSSYSATGADAYFMQGRIAMASAGGGLSSAEMVALYNRTNTYLTAIGAN